MASVPDSETVFDTIVFEDGRWDDYDEEVGRFLCLARAHGDMFARRRPSWFLTITTTPALALSYSRKPPARSKTSSRNGSRLEDATFLSSLTIRERNSFSARSLVPA